MQGDIDFTQLTDFNNTQTTREETPSPAFPSAVQQQASKFKLAGNGAGKWKPITAAPSAAVPKPAGVENGPFRAPAQWKPTVNRAEEAVERKSLLCGQGLW